MNQAAKSDAPPDRRRNNAQLAHQLRELFGIERLRAIGKRVIGIVVYFDQQTVCTGGHRSARHGRNFRAARCRATERQS